MTRCLVSFRTGITGWIYILEKFLRPTTVTLVRMLSTNIDMVVVMLTSKEGYKSFSTARKIPFYIRKKESKQVKEERTIVLAIKISYQRLYEQSEKTKKTKQKTEACYFFLIIIRDKR